jgi:hypothetical protein
MEGSGLTMSAVVSKLEMAYVIRCRREVTMKKALLAVLILLTAGIFQMAFCADEVPRMTKEELKPLIGNPDVVIIDVRSPLDYEASNVKIKGAVREDPRKLGLWLNRYPKEKTLVFY